MIEPGCYIEYNTRNNGSGKAQVLDKLILKNGETVYMCETVSDGTEARHVSQFIPVRRKDAKKIEDQE